MRKMITLFVFAVFCFVKGWGQVPNDDPGSAIVINCGSNYSGNNAAATLDYYEQSYPNDPSSIWVIFGYHGVWFTYTATKKATVTFSVAANWNANIQVTPRGSNGELQDLSSIVSGTSSVTLDINAGQSYYVLLTTDINEYNHAAGGNYVMYANCVYFNDDCANAKPLACGQIVTGDNTNASNEVLPASSCGFPTEGITKGVWYKYTAETTGSATFSTISGASWDTYLRVFSGTCDALSCLGANDDYGGSQSQVTVPVTAGQSYYVLLGGYGSTDYGVYSLTATCCTQPAVTGISGGGTYCTNSSTPDLAISTTGNITDYSWYYNTTNSTTGGTPVGIYPAQPILANLVGTKYYYAVVSSGICGSDTSATQMVTINAAPTSATLTPQQTEICYGSQVQVSATAAGGVKPYTYSFAEAATNTGTAFAKATNKNEPAGTYYVTVKGANGCTLNSPNVTITQPASPIAITPVVTSGICGGNGKIQVSATGGYGDFVYTINTDSVTRKTTPYTFDNLPQGKYTITAIDAHGCAQARSITVGNSTKVPAITGFTGLTTVLNGSATSYHVDSAYNVSYTWTVPSDAVVVSGQGTATASIKWGYKSGKIKITPSSSCAAGVAKQYSITVTHSNSFEANRIQFVKGDAAQDGIRVYPNPTRDIATLQFASDGVKKYTIAVMDLQGKVILRKDVTAAAGTNQVKLDVKGMANGVYLIRITDGKTVQNIKLVKGD